ncbi:hypothetical protein JOF29_007850 [Kribbella aluminosa]|uniref:Uncharacterized protein n=1 Tax=Kribbella aluminosa TaxID=416017 RepID=A0ABS4UYN4_9ACTN|nr:hypothetical protein [Kribbella aluminosa]
MRSEYPQLERAHLVVDAMDSVEMNLGLVRTYIRRT